MVIGRDCHFDSFGIKTSNSVKHPNGNEENRVDKKPQKHKRLRNPISRPRTIRRPQINHD